MTMAGEEAVTMAEPPEPGLCVACTLTPADLATQARHWQEILARALITRTATARGLRPEAGPELRRLVAVERDCCPWATWTVTEEAGACVLTAQSAGDGVAALHTMFAGPGG
jgi:hypothetical protein